MARNRHRGGDCRHSAHRSIHTYSRQESAHTLIPVWWVHDSAKFLNFPVSSNETSLNGGLTTLTHCISFSTEITNASLTKTNKNQVRPEDGSECFAHNGWISSLPRNSTRRNSPSTFDTWNTVDYSPTLSSSHPLPQNNTHLLPSPHISCSHGHDLSTSRASNVAKGRPHTAACCATTACVMPANGFNPKFSCTDKSVRVARRY